MAYDGLINFSVVNELKNKIIGGKIDKIYEPNFEEIVLGIYSNGSKYALQLVINSSCYRANLTTNTKPNPNQAPNFCMMLRKDLLGGRITNIYTNNLERIIFIDFEIIGRNYDDFTPHPVHDDLSFEVKHQGLEYDEDYNFFTSGENANSSINLKNFSIKKLIIELMGKHSNIILVDENNRIIDAMKHFPVISGSYRDIYAGAQYELPKSDKLDFMNINDEVEFYSVLKSNLTNAKSNSLASAISNAFTGISKSSIYSFENTLNISDNITNENSNILFKYLHTIITYNKNVTCKKFESGYSLEYTDSKKEPDLQINFFLDDYYTLKETNTIFTTYRDNLLKLILNKLNKLNIKLDTINSKLNECKNAEKYKLYGELITSNLYRIKDYNTDAITLENFYDNNTPIVIPLDKSLSPSANAKNFFKKYKKLKVAIEYIDVQKSSIIADINYLESIVYEIEIANTVGDIDEIYNEIRETNMSLNSSKQKRSKRITAKKNKSAVGEPFKYDIDGFTVLVGKNNKQNDYLTTKLANKEDIWFHVKDFHGSHVLLRTENKIPSQETINKCAKLAKEHSKAVNSSNVPVDYTFVKYVKKPSRSKPRHGYLY